MFKIEGKYTDAKVMIDDVEPSCVAQIVQMTNHPSFVNPIAIMPDTHAGKGSVIGFTMEIGKSIIPNIVGVDIGCGMLSAPFHITLYDTEEMANFNTNLRRMVPFGTNIRDSVTTQVSFDWEKINWKLRLLSMEFSNRFDIPVLPMVFSDFAFEALCKRVGANHGRVMLSIGTLGGGNHFIEIGKSKNDGRQWVTIHSGSRNLGKCVAEYWQKQAVESATLKITKREYVDFVKANHPKKDWGHMIAAFTEEKKNTNVPRGMEELTGLDMYGYLVDMLVAQEYASLNRLAILQYVNLNALVDFSEVIETVHNFIDFDDWIIRKGAIRAYEGEQIIIPFNMRDGLLICEGKSNTEWNCSAPHGAGRVLSRSAAKATLNIQDAEAQMGGIWTSCIPLDEAPDAYKDSKVIETAIEPTARIIDRIIPIMNFKGEG